MTEYRYEIDGKSYVQRALVLGQVRQLMTEMQGLAINPAAGSAGMIAALASSGQLERVLAVALNPEGVDLRAKDIDALAKELEFGITPEQIVQVVEDFFDCNPTASLLEKLIGTMGKISQSLPAGMRTGSNLLFASLPTGTSLDETPSSGDSPPGSADPTSGTGDGS